MQNVNIGNSSFLEHHIIKIFVVLMAASFIGPVVVFFQMGKNPALSGSLGDLVGGVSAPAINLLAAILVYLSFKKQTQANEIITEQINRDEERDQNALYLSELSSEIYRLEDNFSALDFSRPGEGISARGLYAIRKMLDAFSTTAIENDLKLKHFNQYLYSNAAGQDLLYMLIKCKEIHIDIQDLLSNKNYQQIAQKRLVLVYQFKLKMALRLVTDYVRNELYRSNSHAENAMLALDEHLIIRQLLVLEKDLTVLL